MKTLLSKYNLDFMPKPNEYHLIQDDKLPPTNLITAALGLIFDENRFLMTQLNARGWDIPGGHIEPGESPEAAVRREVYEETAVYIKDLHLFAYDKFVIHAPEPKGYKYPFPISYQAFYLGNVAASDTFTPNGEANARKLFSSDEVFNTQWGGKNPGLFKAALEKIKSSCS
ncbi:MAG: NUDIX domain-containing protein [Chloroflexi bacterium]|nr:NUDIX domain-containing protein [Chloroflexota bacterium]